MHYRSETGACSCIVAGQMLCVLSPGRRTFSVWNDIMVAIWKYEVIKNPTLLIDAHLLEEQSCQISSWSDLKRHSLRLFEDHRSNKNKKNNNKNKTSSDTGSVPDPKMLPVPPLEKATTDNRRELQSGLWPMTVGRNNKVDCLSML